MAELTVRLGLPLMQAAQAQKEITHNDALHDVDRWLGTRLESRMVAAPPVDADPALNWLVPDGATGAWAGHDGKMARFEGAWVFIVPPAGLIAWVADENVILLRGDTGWEVGGLPMSGLNIGGRTMLTTPPQNVGEPAGGTTIDQEARAALVQLIVNLRGLGLVSP